MSSVQITFSSSGVLHDWKDDLDFDSINETLGLLDIYESAVENKVEKKIFSKQALKDIQVWMQRNKNFIPLFEKRGRKLHEDYMHTLDIMSQPITKTKYSH